MRCWGIRAFLVALVLWPGVASAQTYALTAVPYPSVFPASGGAFTVGMQAAGTFVTSAPIGPNLTMADIGPLITSYSFTDGAHTFTPANSAFNVPLNGGTFLVTTNASGAITYAQFIVMTPVPPHTTSTLLNYLAIGDGANGYDQMGCVAVTGSPAVCSQVTFGATASRAFSSSFSIVLVPPVPVMPTWVFALLAAVIAVVAARQLRRRRVNFVS